MRDGPAIERRRATITSPGHIPGVPEAVGRRGASVGHRARCPVPTFRCLLVIVLAWLLAFHPARAQDATLGAELERIARETAAIRGLPPLTDLDDVLLSRDELLVRLPQLIAQDIDAEDAAAQSRSLAALGLLPDGTDLYDLTLRLIGEQAAGYYDPITDEMIVITDGDAELGAEEYFYAHENVHPLQDAHPDPNDLMEEPPDTNSDASLAALALYEGDAVAASTAYLEQRPGLSLEILAEGMPEFPELDAAPGAVVVALLFPYTEGAEFVARLRRDGGWDAVNAAYADLPASTEQVLHPGKYVQRDSPVSVVLPGPEALGDGWTSVDEDTLGELQTALLLAALGPGEGINTVTGAVQLPEAARNAAAGWDGDRYALWENDGQEVLLWRSVWDTPAEARAFSRALAQFQQTRWGGLFSGENPDDVALIAPRIAARIQLDGQEVRYVQSPDPALADAALAALQAAPPPAPAPGPD